MSCLFQALIDAVPKTPKPGHLVVRNALVDYILTNPRILDEAKDVKNTEVFNISKAVEWLGHGSLERYCERMRSPSEWGGALEILAFTRLYSVNVHVKVSSTGKVIEFKSLEPGARIIKINYNGVHYWA